MSTIKKCLKKCLPSSHVGRGLVAGLLFMLCAACSDVVDPAIDDYTPQNQVANTGAPKITAVYDAQDAVRQGTEISEAMVGRMVRLVGENLNSVRSVRFNRVEADLSLAYTASTFANVVIPERFSTEKFNQIEYTTDQGTATFAFRVLPKPIVVEGLRNEFAGPDELLAIVGSNLDCYGFDTGEGQLTFNGSVVALSSVTADAITFVRPIEAGDNSQFVLSWKDGEGQPQSALLRYRPTTRMLFGDCTDEWFKIEGGDGQALQWSLETDADIQTGAAALGYPHVHLVGTMDQWAWNWVNVCQNVAGLDTIGNRQNYNLVFEVMTSESHPLPASMDEEVNGFTFGINQEGSRGCEWEIAQSFDTKGQWRTVRLPLKKVMVKGGYTHPGSQWTQLQMVFQAMVQGSYDLRLANFRVERVANPAEWTDETETPDTPDGPDTPDTPNEDGNTLFDTPTVIASDWSTSVQIGADKFANAQVGDVVTVYVSHINDGAQIKLSCPTGSWEALAPSVDCISLNAADTQFAMPLTEAILAQVKANGMAIQGHDFTVERVTLDAAE